MLNLNITPQLVERWAVAWMLGWGVGLVLTLLGGMPW